MYAHNAKKKTLDPMQVRCEILDHEQHRDLIALRAAIDEGLKSGVSQRSVTDILNAKEAQLKQDGRS
jgi:hypothetical protein